MCFFRQIGGGGFAPHLLGIAERIDGQPVSRVRGTRRFAARLFIATKSRLAEINTIASGRGRVGGQTGRFGAQNGPAHFLGGLNHFLRVYLWGQEGLFRVVKGGVICKGNVNRETVGWMPLRNALRGSNPIMGLRARCLSSAPTYPVSLYDRCPESAPPPNRKVAKRGVNPGHL